MELAVDHDDYVDHDRPRYSEAVQVSTLISLSLREKLRNRARKSGQGLQDYLRSMIVREMGFADDNVAATDDPLPKAQVAAPVAVMADVSYLDRHPDTIVGMVARGYTPMQIASMRRIPYRAVMAELGRGIDAAAAVNGKSATCGQGIARSHFPHTDEKRG